MSDRLYHVLLERETDIVNEMERQIDCSNARHYTDLDWEVLHRRVGALVAHFMMSVRETPDIFTRYVKEMSEERIHEGFKLAETLMALRVLEEQVWNIIVEKIEIEWRTQALARVTCIIGHAKDTMANHWIENTPGPEVDTQHVG